MASISGTGWREAFTLYEIPQNILDDPASCETIKAFDSLPKEIKAWALDDKTRPIAAKFRKVFVRASEDPAYYSRALGKQLKRAACL